jgi:elongation factor 1-alpha
MCILEKNIISNILEKYKITTNIVIKQLIIPKQPKEYFYGNREYKYKLINLNDKKIEKRSTQCLFRLIEGNGKACYFIGIDDNGNVLGLNIEDLLSSLDNLLKIFINITADIYKISIYKISSDKYILFIKIKKQLDVDLI